MGQKNVEFIAVGTELLLGQIANTNAQWFSEQLNAYGFNMYHHTVVGDNLSRVKDVFIQAQNRSDIVIVSGGLGPTEDDLTREAFQAMTNLSIRHDEQALRKITAYFDKQGTRMTTNNQRQARIFTSATVLENKLGMAPGMRLIYNGVLWVFLPGVPREIKQIASDDVIPYLAQSMSDNERIESRVIKCIGIGESMLEDTLGDLIQQQTNPTIALLAQQDGITIRLTVKATSQQSAQAKLDGLTEKIEDRIRPYIYGYNDDTIERKIIQLLQNSHQTIAAAESITGGGFTHKLIQEEGASAVCPGSIVSYGTEIKRELLGIPEQLIETDGVISEQCAIQMAKNICTVMQSSLGISFTGVAGPSTTEGKEIGTTYISIYCVDGTYIVRHFVFSGTRQAIQRQAVLKGCELLLNFLLKEDNLRT